MTGSRSLLVGSIIFQTILGVITIAIHSLSALQIHVGTSLDHVLILQQFVSRSLERILQRSLIGQRAHHLHQDPPRPAQHIRQRDHHGQDRHRGAGAEPHPAGLRIDVAPVGVEVGLAHERRQDGRRLQLAVGFPEDRREEDEEAPVGAVRDEQREQGAGLERVEDLLGLVLGGRRGRLVLGRQRQGLEVLPDGVDSLEQGHAGSCRCRGGGWNGNSRDAITPIFATPKVFIVSAVTRRMDQKADARIKGRPGQVMGRNKRCGGNWCSFLAAGWPVAE